MRILLLNQYALPRGAPGITRHGDIAAELVESGNAVTIIASGFDYLTRQADRSAGRARRVEVVDGATFVWLRTGSYRRNDARRIGSMLRYALSAVREGLRGPRPDVVIGSSPHLLAALAAAMVARFRSAPFVLEVRDIWPATLVDLGAIRRGGLVHQCLLLLERWLYRRAARIVMVPPHGCIRLEEVGLRERRCTHIPNATSVSMHGATTVTAAAADRTGFTIVYAGAHGVANGLTNVVDAVDQLRSRKPDVYKRLRVVLVGDGQERAAIADDARARGLGQIRVHGPVPKSEIPELLAGADACLLHLARADVFRYGLSPNKLFDYLAAAKPVLISSDTPTIVDTAGAGIRFSPGDPTALADAIVRLMGVPPEERALMGERGRSYAATHHSIAAVSRRYETLLLELVAERGR